MTAPIPCPLPFDYQVTSDFVPNRLDANILRTQGLTKLKNGQLLLRDVALEITRKTVHGLIATPGGKAAFDLIGKTEQPTRGKIIYNGSDITRLRREQLREIGIEQILSGGCSAKGGTVLTFARLAMSKPLGSWLVYANPRYRRKEAIEILESAGLGHCVQMDLSQISRFQRLMLSLRLHVSKSTELLLLEHPFLKLREEETLRLKKEIRSIAKGRTVLIMDTNAASITDCFDRITLIDYGQIRSKDIFTRVSV